MAMRMSARGAVTVASKAKKLRGFGKAWKVGDKGIVLYPLFHNEETGDVDLLVAACWGYKVNDMNALGVKAIFIPSNAEINDDGEPVVPDVTSQFSRLAPAFVAGEKNRKMMQIDSKAWPTPSAMKAASTQLENEYDVKNNPKAKKSVISRLQLYISTEVIYVPIVADKPDWANAALYSQALSNDRISKLYAIINDSKFNITPDSRYLEVQYDFVATDGEKSTAGRCQPVGITPEYALKNRFPDDASKLDMLVNQLPEDSKIIMNHNYSYRKISESTLRAAYSAYAVMHSEDLDTLPDDAKEQATKSARLIKELSILPMVKDESLVNLINEELAKEEPVAAPIKPAAVADGAPKITDLMNNPARAADEDQEELDDVNL